MVLKKRKGFLKRFISFFVALGFIVINFSGCLSGVSKETPVLTLNDCVVNFEDYLLVDTLKYAEFENKLRSSNKDIKEVILSDLDDKAIEESKSINYYRFINDEEIKNMLYVYEAAKKLGIKLSAAEEQQIAQQAISKLKELNLQYGASENGISIKSCEKYVRYQTLNSRIGPALYGKGKEKEVKEEDILNYGRDRNKVAKYKLIPFTKKFETLKLKDCKDDKKEKEEEKNEDETEEEKKQREEKEKKEKEKQDKEQDELAIEKHFKVKTVKELSKNFLDSIKKGELGFSEIETKLSEAFKKNYHPSNSEYMYFEKEKGEKEQDFMRDSKKDEKIKEKLKRMEDGDCTIFEFNSELYMLKRFSVEEDLKEKKDQEEEDEKDQKNKFNSKPEEMLKKEIKGRLERQRKNEYMDKIIKENKEKIENNEEKFNDKNKDKIIRKQTKNILAKTKGKSNQMMF